MVTTSSPSLPSESELARDFARICAEVLGLASAGEHDSFFDLGGRSLDAARFAVRLSAHSHRQVPLTQVFRTPTPAALAAYAMHATAGVAERAEVRRGELLPALPNQEAYLEADRRRRLSGTDDRTLTMGLAVRIRGPLDADALDAAVRRAIATHDALRIRFVRQDDGHYGQRVQAAIPARLRRRELPGVSDDELVAAVRELCFQGFDRLADDLVDPWLFRLGPADHLLLIKVDHLVCDGWSAGVLLGDLARDYAALRAGAEPDPPAEPVRYGDYVWSTADWLAGRGGARALEFWRRKLDGVTPKPTFVLPFAPRTPGPPQVVGHHDDLSLPAELLGRLPDRGGELTAFMVFAAAVATLLHCYTGQPAVGMVTPTANRSDPALQRVVGWVASTVIIRVDLAGDPTLAEVTDSARQGVLDAVEHGRYPKHELIRRLMPEDFGQVRQGTMAYLDTAFDELVPPELPGCETGLFEWADDYPIHGMSFSLFPRTPPAARVSWEGDWLSAAQGAELCADLAGIAAALLAEPDTRVSELAARLRLPIAVPETGTPATAGTRAR